MIYLIKTIESSNYLFRHFAIYLFLFILGTFLPFTIYGQFSGGSGTTQDPYLIGNIQQLQAVSSVSNTAHFRLISDIDASQTATWNNGQGFEPISYQNGSLDGNNFSISNLVINRTNEDRAALIEHIGPNCTVKDLTLENVNISGKTRTASLCGVLSGEIQNVFVSGTINGDDNSGGLAGEIYSGSNVSDCRTNANVMSSGSTVGGLIGYNNSAIVENYSTYGSVNGKNQVGGLIVKNEGDVISSQSAAVVTGSGDNIGGLIGLNNDGDISNSSSEGEVNGKKNTGGLIGFNGYNGSTITNCHSTANVNGRIHVGGLVGFNQDGLIELCYSTGIVNGETETGGLVGYMAYGSSVISQCFSTSEVFGQHSNIGGLVGAIQSGTIVNSYAIGTASGNNKDEIVIEFGHADKISGSRKKFSFIETAPSLYILINGIAYSLHHYTTLEYTPVIPVSFKPGVDGSHVIKVNFDDAYFKMFILEDKKTGNKHDFLSNPEYSFQASSTDNPERFVLHFVEGNFADTHDLLPVHIYSYDKTLYLDMRLVQENTKLLSGNF